VRSCWESHLAECSQARTTYGQCAGASGDRLVCDGDVEFDNRRVCRPVSGAFTLLFEVLRVEGQQRLVVSVEIDGTQEDLEVHRLRSTKYLDV